MQSYRAPWWLPGGNLQTIYATLLDRRYRVAYRRERWDTPDGDFIDVDRVDGQPDKPLVVLFHGLEGNSYSHYATSLMCAVRELGWRGAVVLFRSCSGEINRLPRAYHSGDSAEMEWILRRLKAQNPHCATYAVGVSLGGNVLLKWLGEQAEKAGKLIKAAVTVSATLDLMVAGDYLGRGFNLFYTRAFLVSMKQKLLQKLERFPGLVDRQAMLCSSTLRQFDDVVTAPLHGYKNTDDYWTRASSKRVLTNIRVPTLIIHAKNDPFLPASALPSPSEVSPLVTLDYPDTGGHAGFVSGMFPGHLDWLPQRILEFFNKQSERIDAREALIS
ncbi:MAG TPA: alpha/beta fold hydrolase [Burkholderiales bacterium]|nr:alpha/beta fold hydrolase [Burkholderiales bacterium]